MTIRGLPEPLVNRIAAESVGTARGTATLAAFAVEWIGSAPCRVRGDLSCDNGALEILGASG